MLAPETSRSRRFHRSRARPEMPGILPISIRSQCLQRSGHRVQVGRAGVRLAPGC